MSCVVRWWDVLFVKGMHFSSKNALLLNLVIGKTLNLYFEPILPWLRLWSMIVKCL